MLSLQGSHIEFFRRAKGRDQHLWMTTAPKLAKMYVRFMWILVGALPLKCGILHICSLFTYLEKGNIYLSIFKSKSTL